jgi:hypothetical protein
MSNNPPPQGAIPADPAALAAAQAALIQAQAQVQALLPAGGVPIPFSIGPGSANDLVINFSSSMGIKLFQAATMSLYKEKGFDVNSEGIHNFVAKVGQHGVYNGYAGGTGILDIPNDPADPLGPTTSLIIHYGVVTLEQVQQNVQTYVRTQTRALQDSSRICRVVAFVSTCDCWMITLNKSAPDKCPSTV